MLSKTLHRVCRALLPTWLVLLTLCAPLACQTDRHDFDQLMSDRIVAPPQSPGTRRLPPASQPAPAMVVTTRPAVEHPVASMKAPEDSEWAIFADESRAASQPAQILTLDEAIRIAFQKQPRLRVYIEGINQAQQNREIAFSPYLPTVAAGYSVGWADVRTRIHDVDVNGQLGPISLPIPLNSIALDHENNAFQLADLSVQWLICDFGRRLGRYRQAGLAVDIATLQTERAYQTVASEVSVAYYEVLRRRALRRTAQDAVRRAQDDLDVARNLEKGGVVEKEKRLRAEVQLAENRRLLDATEGAETVAIAALNLAIGLNANTPVDIQESSEVPPFTKSLAECLERAVAQRREFRIAQQSIRIADEGQRVAKADFAPRIVATGSLADLQMQDPGGYGDLLVGSINLEWALYEGGRRVAEVRLADSKTREAIAQAKSIADTIAFQVTTAYRFLVTARLGIERSRPAVAQADENYRLVQARAKVGDATSSDITDAESTLTRAQQEYLNSIHDYLIAIVGLEYAMGVTAVPGSPAATGKTGPGGA